MDRGVTGVAVHEATVGASYDLVLSRHRYGMRVYSKNRDRDRDRDIYRYRYTLIER